MIYDRVVGIYDSAVMRLDTATTFWVPEGMSLKEVYWRVLQTDEYAALEAMTGGDVGRAVWSLPGKVEIESAGERRLLFDGMVHVEDER